MKAYFALVLVALLFNIGSSASVGKTHLKPSSSEDVVVQVADSSNESDDLNNVVDNDNAVLSNNVNDENVSNNVNLESVPVVSNAPTKTLQVKPVSVAVPVSTVNTVPIVNTVSAVPVQSVQNVVKAQVQRNNVLNVVKGVQAPVVYSQVPQVQQQYVYQPQQQLVYTVPQQQNSVQTVQWPQQQQAVQWQAPQQYAYTVPQQQQQHQVVYSQVPQQEQVVYQPQQQQTVQWQQPQTVSYATVKTNVVQPHTVLVRKNVVLEQTRPIQYATKTVVNKVNNPIVYQLSPSKTVANTRQTVLTNAQIVSNFADESAKSDVVVQETENY